MTHSKKAAQDLPAQTQLLSAHKTGEILRELNKLPESCSSKTRAVPAPGSAK